MLIYHHLERWSSEPLSRKDQDGNNIVARTPPTITKPVIKQMQAKYHKIRKRRNSVNLMIESAFSHHWHEGIDNECIDVRPKQISFGRING